MFGSLPANYPEENCLIAAGGSFFPFAFTSGLPGDARLARMSLYIFYHIDSGGGKPPSSKCQTEPRS
jgi:hypothetical protein